MDQRGDEPNEEYKRAALDYFLDDHEVDSKMAEIYERMVDPSDDTPELVKKLSENKKKLHVSLKKTKEKIKTKTEEASKKLATRAEEKDENPEAQQILNRLQVAQKYEPPKKGATRINITEGMMPGVPLLPLQKQQKQHKRRSSFSKAAGFTLPHIHFKLPHVYTRLRRALFLAPQRILQALHSRRRRRTAFAIMAVAVLAIVGVRSMQQTRSDIAGKNAAANKKTDKKGTGSGAQVAGDTVTKPEFATLVPTNTADIIKENQRYDAAKKVATFEDSLDGNTLLVSQQKVTSKETGDPNFLSKLATSLYLKTQIDTNYGSAYMGLNVERKIQTVAFMKEDLLVFIQSSNTLDVKTWAQYINGLHPQQ